VAQRVAEPFGLDVRIGLQGDRDAESRLAELRWQMWRISPSISHP